MIPLPEINAWREHAPWPSQDQVEQDLLITRAMAAIFSDPFLRSEVAMRGGTALHKVHLAPAIRYSEDIDLVLVGNASEADVEKALRRVLAPVLGRPRAKLRDRIAIGARNLVRPSRLMRLTYDFNPTGSADRVLSLKVEVNCNERKPVHDIVDLDYRIGGVAGPSGVVTLRTYDINEMLGTKMRALYQRDQGRDLLDLWWAMEQGGTGPHPTDPTLIVAAFQEYMSREGTEVDADTYEQALAAKLANPSFALDLEDLLRVDTVDVDLERWAGVVRDTLVDAMRRRAANTP